MYSTCTCGLRQNLSLHRRSGSPTCRSGGDFHALILPERRAWLLGEFNIQLTIALPYPFGYNPRVVSFHRTEEFDVWLRDLNDKVGRGRIIHRIRSAEHGNLGDCESVGEAVSEMRIHVGPGYRVYFTRREEAIYLLLLGGDKSSQRRDIKRAIAIARALDKE